MPAVKFPQYLRRHGLYMFLVANKKYLPGLILRREGQAFWEHDELRGLLKQATLTWQTELVEANIPDVIKGKSKVGAHGELKLPFLSIQGGLEKNHFVDFSIGAVRQCIFKEKKLRYWNRLSKLLKKLKNEDPDVWSSIKGHYLVLSTWYATEYSVNLGRAWKGKLGADLKRKFFPKVGAKVNIDPNKKIVNVSGNFMVPFAFHGEKL